MTEAQKAKLAKIKKQQPIIKKVEKIQREVVTMEAKLVRRKKELKILISRLSGLDFCKNDFFEIDFIQTACEILKDGSYKQSDLVKEIKQSVSVGDNRALKLLEKFEGTEWITERADKNSKIYSLPPKAQEENKR